MLGEGIQLAVAIYHNIYPAKKPSAQYVDGRTNAPLKVETSWLCKETGKHLLPHEIRSYFPFGGEAVCGCGAALAHRVSKSCIASAAATR